MGLMLPFFYFIYLNNFYTTKDNDYIFLSFKLLQ